MENFEEQKEVLKSPTIIIIINYWIIINHFDAGIFFKILGHPVYKMWILQEPKKDSIMK